MKCTKWKISNFLNNHSCAYGFVGALVNKYNASGDAIFPVAVVEQRRGGTYLNPGNVIHANTFIVLHTVQGIDVYFVAYIFHDTANIFGGVF